MIFSLLLQALLLADNIFNTGAPMTKTGDLEILCIEPHGEQWQTNQYQTLFIYIESHKEEKTGKKDAVTKKLCNFANDKPIILLKKRQNGDNNEDNDEDQDDGGRGSCRHAGQWRRAGCR